MSDETLIPTETPPETAVVPAEAPPSALDDFMVVATDPAEMRVAQERIVAWAAAHLRVAETRVAEALANVETARKSKWKMTGWQRIHTEEIAKFEYYQKLHAALEQGYVIVPNFPIDIFAIRTTRKKPLRDETTSQWQSHAQKSDRPELGAGEYKDKDPLVYQRTAYEWSEKDQKDIAKTKYFAHEFMPVDFPIKLVKPRILDDTAKALTLKVFDELGILPSRRPKGDPMVIGQIVYKRNTYHERRVSFLVTWWLSASDLEV